LLVTTERGKAAHVTDDTILTTSSEGCLIITLARPDRMNAWNMAMRAKLVETLEAASKDPTVTSIVLTGAGERAFCAGQDLNEASDFDEDFAEIWIDDFARLYRAVRSLEVPVVSAINGVAAGSAFQFVLLTDIRIGHSGVRMGQPEINSGIASITGPWIMREVLGLSRTIELTLTGRMMGADEALRIGVLHEIVAQDRVLDRATEVARDLGAKPQTAMKLIKRRFFEVLEPGLDDAIAAAKVYHRMAIASGEMHASTQAFLDARGGRKRD
jgi:enoyl-CoA hydratase/carnithine racemase